MHNARYIHLLNRYQDNLLSENELIELFNWINSPEGEVEYDRYLSDQLHEAEKETTGESVSLSNDMMRKIRKKANIPSKSFFHFHELHKYAAILIVALLMGSGVWFFADKNNMKEDYIVFSTTKGNKGTLILPDGTETFINAESKITYSKSRQREIYLEGEAYLSVTKDEKHPFTVHTSGADIIVFGTIFNISAHSGDSLMQVSLVEGSVGIQISGREDITRIVPGQTAQIDAKSQKISLQDSDMTDLALWRNDELQLTDVNLTALCHKLESWYGISIILHNQSKKQHLYNLTIQRESIEEVLKLINSITPITYNIKGKEVNMEYRKSNK
jgi:ferric-dicitrate binding protein FerR (iron transport regulator)